MLRKFYAGEFEIARPKDRLVQYYEQEGTAEETRQRVLARAIELAVEFPNGTGQSYTRTVQRLFRHPEERPTGGYYFTHDNGDTEDGAYTIVRVRKIQYINEVIAWSFDHQMPTPLVDIETMTHQPMSTLSSWNMVNAMMLAACRAPEASLEHAQSK